jgi:hypothetical protein
MHGSTTARRLAAILLAGCLCASASADPARRAQRRGIELGTTTSPAELPPPNVAPMTTPAWPSSPDGLFVTAAVGGWAPVGGDWDDLTRAGPVLSFGVGTVIDDWAGDMLPPSSTRIALNYTYASLNDDTATQLFTPSGFVGEVDYLRLHFGEIEATQRFAGPFGKGSFFDVGAALGLGGADGSIVPAPLNLSKQQLAVSEVKEDGFVVRGELNAGIGWQIGVVDLKAEFVVGVSGSDALTGEWGAYGDIGGRLGGTIYLFP